MSQYGSWMMAAILVCSAAMAGEETPEQTLARFRKMGGSNCNRAFSVGGSEWNGGNDGLSVLASPLPKSISLLNVSPIDGRPLTKQGLSHIASGQKTVVIRFRGACVDDEGLRDFVQALNASGNRHQSLEFRHVDITDAGVEYLVRIKEIHKLKLIETKISADGSRRVERAFPKIDFEYVPRVTADPAEPSVDAEGP